MGAPRWKPEEVSAVKGFIRGERASVPAGRTPGGIGKKFAEDLGALRELKERRAPCHAATRELYARLKAAPLKSESGSHAALEAAVNTIFCVGGGRARVRHWRRRGRALPPGRVGRRIMIRF